MLMEGRVVQATDFRKGISGRNRALVYPEVDGGTTSASRRGAGMVDAAQVVQRSECPCGFCIPHSARTPRGRGRSRAIREFCNSSGDAPEREVGLAR